MKRSQAIPSPVKFHVLKLTVMKYCTQGNNTVHISKICPYFEVLCLRKY